MTHARDPRLDSVWYNNQDLRRDSEDCTLVSDVPATHALNMELDPTQPSSTETDPYFSFNMQNLADAYVSPIAAASEEGPDSFYTPPMDIDEIDQILAELGYYASPQADK